ncbi:MAG: hypothetical protein LBQ98_04480 [Nitrososphaerota archaeon]|jgi:hypothetical protein|nr:hypothetical protein [Nitrososphaerota archaeon]
MVKLGFYIVKKRYKKDIYTYEEVCMRFPKELHDFLRCLHNHDLEVRASREGQTTIIKLIDKQDPHPLKKKFPDTNKEK